MDVDCNSLSHNHIAHVRERERERGLTLIKEKLHRDQLRAVFHVSQRIRKAVVIARQFYFNYTTPDRSRQEMLRTMTPLPTEHWPFRGDGKGTLLPSPKTPQSTQTGSSSTFSYEVVRGATYINCSLPGASIFCTVHGAISFAKDLV